MKVTFENVKVIAAGEMRSGVGNNGEWKVQPYIVEDEIRHEKYEVEVWNDKVELTPGQTVSFDAFVNAREYNGRYYYSFRASQIVGSETVLSAQPVVQQMQQQAMPKPTAPTQSGLPF